MPSQRGTCQSCHHFYHAFITPLRRVFGECQSQLPLISFEDATTHMFKSVTVEHLEKICFNYLPKQQLISATSNGKRRNIQHQWVMNVTFISNGNKRGYAERGTELCYGKNGTAFSWEKILIKEDKHSKDLRQEADQKMREPEREMWLDFRWERSKACVIIRSYSLFGISNERIKCCDSCVMGFAESRAVPGPSGRLKAC